MLALILFILKNLNDSSVEDVLLQIEGDQLDLSDAQNIQYYIDMLREKNVHVSDIENISRENK